MKLSCALMRHHRSDCMVVLYKEPVKEIGEVGIGTGMSHKPSFITRLTIISILLSLFAPAAFLVCQGSSCGTTYGYCCCAALDRKPDGIIPRLHGPSSPFSKSSLAAAECDCHDVIVCVDRLANFARAVSGLVNTSGASFVLRSRIASAPESTYVAAPLISTVEFRGPPRTRIIQTSHSLRAPPLA
jgi:hypothetical protein